MGTQTDCCVAACAPDGVGALAKTEAGRVMETIAVAAKRTRFINIPPVDQGFEGQICPSRLRLTWNIENVNFEMGP
jgi:hypothetical protein